MGLKSLDARLKAVETVTFEGAHQDGRESTQAADQTITESCGKQIDGQGLARDREGKTMGVIIKFPIRSGSKGSIWCEPLQCYFPQVFHGVQRITGEWIAEWGVVDVEPGEYHLFTLVNDCEKYPGVKVFEPITRLEMNADRSLIVRWHGNEEIASTYLTGVADMNPSEGYSIYRSDQGIFTLVECRTRGTWPAPMLFYVAEYNDPKDQVIMTVRVTEWTDNA
jgi:hypothetical protein